MHKTWSIVNDNLIIILLLSLPLSAKSLQIHKELDHKQLGFSFETKGNHNFMVGSIEWRDLIVVLPRDKYSKENLELLFDYFSREYPNKRQILRVTLYAGSDAYEHRSSPNQVFTGRLRYQALYKRVCNNEYYFYVPDLSEPEKSEQVILKGRIEPLERISDDCN